jgi:uncharacterized membrane protein YeaQ/YmgE (transglycosylase-associated protein family)
MESWISWPLIPLIIGAGLGWIYSTLTEGRGLIGSVILGAVGGVVASFLCFLVLSGGPGYLYFAVLGAAFVGAIALLHIVHLIKK